MKGAARRKSWVGRAPRRIAGVTGPRLKATRLLPVFPSSPPAALKLGFTDTPRREVNHRRLRTSQEGRADSTCAQARDNTVRVNRDGILLGHRDAVGRAHVRTFTMKVRN